MGIIIMIYGTFNTSFTEDNVKNGRKSSKMFTDDDNGYDGGKMINIPK